jgi:hypothetical protein
MGQFLRMLDFGMSKDIYLWLPQMWWTNKLATGGFIFTYYNDDSSRATEAIGIS